MKIIFSRKKKVFIGGKFYKQFICLEEKRDGEVNPSVEKYFRPSKMPILNRKEFNYEFYDKYYNKVFSQISLPRDLFNSPYETLINYYSILREAANYEEGKKAGCGSIGEAKSPYPIAYNFLSKSYQSKLSYSKYLNSFKNVLHINLIKLKEIPSYIDNVDKKKYFVEIETIEGSDKDAAYFAYYYGYIYLSKEEGIYKIVDMIFYGENYLCAPYHGWSFNGEYVVDIEYGNWCSLVKERYPTVINGYIKTIPFKGTDGYDYKIEFIQLTNDTDVEIAQYRKNINGKWEFINYDPKDCIKNKE